MSKKARTSESCAALRSSIDPMTVCAYAKHPALSNGQIMPSMKAGEYGWLSTRRRRSSFTVSRWFWKCSSVMASEPKRQVQAIRGQRLVVVGAVLRRTAVLRPAGPRDQLEVLALLHVGRALEHHVLEQVREARAARPLVARAGVVPHVHRHDGRRVILRVDDAQAVGKRERFVGDLAGLAEQPGSERGAKQQQSGDDGRDAGTIAHSALGTTGPDRTSSNENAPSRVSPFTTRRGPVRVA